MLYRFLISHEAINVYKQSQHSLNMENIYIQLGSVLFYKLTNFSLFFALLNS